jgi:hypothetical protein
MREDCKFFQRRSHAAGDVTSFCALDLAPEAPWRCPADCKRYERSPVGGARTGPTGVTRGGLDGRPDDPEPGSDAASVLGSAAEIIGALAPELAAEEQRRRQVAEAAESSWWNRLRRSDRWRR